MSPQTLTPDTRPTTAALATAAIPTERPRVGSALGAPRPVPFARLVRVELRKMVDTLAGRWLVIITIAVAVSVMALLIAFGDPEEVSIGLNLEVVGLPFGILLPVLGIMAATAEWSQRAGLVTFTLEPRRGRVIASRIAAGIVLGAGVVLVVTVAAVLATAAAGLTGVPTSYALPAWVFLGFLALMLLSLVQGIAFGFLFLNTPAAIVSILALPMVFTLASAFNERVAQAAEWLDLGAASAPLTAGAALTGTQLGQLATSSLVWIVLPLAIGAWRVLRREVK